MASLLCLKWKKKFDRILTQSPPNMISIDNCKKKKEIVIQQDLNHNVFHNWYYFCFDCMMRNEEETMDAIEKKRDFIFIVTCSPFIILFLYFFLAQIYFWISFLPFYVVCVANASNYPYILSFLRSLINGVRHLYVGCVWVHWTLTITSNDKQSH